MRNHSITAATRLLALLAVLVGAFLACYRASPRADTHPARGTNSLDQFGDPLPAGAITRCGTIRLRSPHDIDRVALSPDGKFLVTDNSYSGLLLWDATTGLLIRELPTVLYRRRLTPPQPNRYNDPVSEQVVAMTFLDDSRHLRVFTRNGVIRDCDVAEARWGEPLAWTRNPGADEDDFAHWILSRDQTHFAYVPSSQPYRVEVFTLGQETPIVEIRDEKFGEWGRTCAFSPDNRLLAIRLDDSTIKVWDVGTGRAVRTYSGPDLRLLNFAYSPDGRSLAAVFAPKSDSLRLGIPNLTLLAWDVDTGKERFRTTDWDGYIAGYSRDGSKILCIAGSVVRIVDAASGNPMGQLAGHGQVDWVGFAISVDGEHIATAGGRDSSVIIWDLKTRKPTLDFDAPRGSVATVAFSPDGKTLFSGNTTERVCYLWDAGTGRCLHKLPTPTFLGFGVIPLTAAFTPDGRHILVGYGIRGTNRATHWTARLWRVKDGRPVRDFGGHTDGVHQVLVSPDGKHFVIRDGQSSLTARVKVRVWDAWSGALKKEMDWVDRGNCMQLAYTGGGELIGVASLPGAVSEVTNFSSGQITAKWGAPSRAFATAISPDGSLLATQEYGGTLGSHIVIRRTATGEAVSILQTIYPGAQDCMVFSPDGKRIALGPLTGDDVVLFDTATGRPTRSMKGHKGGILAIAFSPDGRLLATGSRDTTVLIWDLGESR